MKKIDSPEFESLTPEEKEQEILKRKKVFMKRTIIAAVIVLVGIPIFTLGLKIRKEMIQDRVRFTSNPPAETPQVIIKEEDVPTDWDYTNTNLQISLRYPSNSTLTDTFDTGIGEGNVAIKYSKDDDPNFIQGWVVKVTVFSTKIRDLNQFANTRLEAMKQSCPDTAVYSKTSDGKMGEHISINFNIDYCEGYYRNYYISYGGKFFEISRYYKGDIGYRQQYETETLAVVNSIQFLPESFVVNDFLKAAKDETTGVSFEYPSHMINTCSIPLPTDLKYRTILSMCEEEDPESGVIVSVLPLERGDTFESILETEKNKMYDDFYAAKGYPPNGKEENIEFNGNPAVKLTDFHWRGTYYIYTTVVKDGRSNVVIIGVKENSHLGTTISGILDSIKLSQ